MKYIHSINIFIEGCLKKNNQKLIEDPQNEYKDFSIPSVKKIIQFNLRTVIMDARNQRKQRKVI